MYSQTIEMSKRKKPIIEGSAWYLQTEFPKTLNALTLHAFLCISNHLFGSLTTQTPCIYGPLLGS